MSEFDLIAEYFTWEESQNFTNDQPSKIIKNIGDDAAVLSLEPNHHLVTSIDTLVSGVHFPENTKAYDIGFKALAANLSDLAAMGSKPQWFTLALTLPDINHEWLSDFSRGLKTLADEVGISLVGGDTTSGPLSISIQVIGSVEKGMAVYRNGAKYNDKIYTTGTLGDAAAGLFSLNSALAFSQADTDYCQQRLNRPTPRLDESMLIKDFATACIDVSDGLLQDLTHILKQSNLIETEITLGAEIDYCRIPFSKALKSIATKQATEFALTGGDDYELLFTIPESVETQFLESCKFNGFQFARIGTITDKEGIVDLNSSPLNTTGFNHFA